MKHFWKQYGFSVVTALLLTVFTGYALLDTFVIPKSYTAAGRTEAPSAAVYDDTEETPQSAALLKSTDTAALETEDTGRLPAAAETLPAVTDSSYRDENISVQLQEYRENGTTIYVADVALSSPDSLMTALAEHTYGKNVKAKTSEIASDNDAVLAVNGDFYGARNSGYVIRNGVLYRDKSAGNEDLVVYADGSFEIVSERDVTAQELLERGAVQVFSFGPALVENGEVAVTEGQEVGQAMSSNPRTAIGIIGEGHYVFVVSDGRTEESAGLSLSELAQFMQRLGVKTAYNLDGGGSSTMVFNGTVINTPTTSGKSQKERSVSDIVYISA